ncbi:MAG: 50S ribosomal protein L7/L12, partial [Elusimicrobiota bacterium]
MAKKKSAVDTILQEVEKLTVIELSELVSAMEEKFGVSAQAPVAQVAAGVQAGGQAEEEKSEF